MNREMLISLLSALDFTVAEDGMISDGVLHYGVVGLAEIRSPKGETLRINKVESLSHTELDPHLTIRLTDKTEHVFTGELVNRTTLVPQEVSPQYAAAINRPAPDDMGAFNKVGNGGLKSPRTLSSLNAVFPVLYPNWREHMYYDELSETEMVDMALFGAPMLGLRTVDDTVLSMYHEDIEIRLRDTGFDVSRVPTNQVKDEVFTIRVMSNVRNPFREWVESIPWDGTPRLETWFSDLFGASSVVLGKEDDAKYLGAVARAWFLGAIARMYGPTQHDIVPVFIGGQGAGKTRALKYTAGQDQWYRSTSIEMTAKDTARFLDSVRGGIIVELGEATQLEGKASMGMIKQFISQDSDHLRKAYARKEQAYPRHFIMAATSNKAEIFADPTGNRRFFPMMCDPNKQTIMFSVNDRSVGSENVEQLWAEALDMYRRGMRPVLTRDEIYLAEQVQDFYACDQPRADLIDEWLDDPVNGFSEPGARITKIQIMDFIFGRQVDGAAVNRIAEDAYEEWTERTRSWVKCRPFRVKGDLSGKPRRGWERIAAPDQTVRKTTFAMVSSAANREEIERTKDVIDFRVHVKALDLKPGMEVTTLISPSELERFLARGFLSDVTQPRGRRRIVVAVIP